MTTTVDPENAEAPTRRPEELRPEDTPIEGTVLTPRHVGMLKVAVVVMGIMLLVGLAALIVGLVYQASKVGGETPPAAPAAAVPAPPAPADPIAMAPAASGALPALDIPQGANVVSMSLDGQRLALHVRSREKAEIVVVDLRTGKVVSRLNIETAPTQ